MIKDRCKNSVSTAPKSCSSTKYRSNPPSHRPLPSTLSPRAAMMHRVTRKVRFEMGCVEPPCPQLHPTDALAGKHAYTHCKALRNRHRSRPGSGGHQNTWPDLHNFLMTQPQCIYVFPYNVNTSFQKFDGTRFFTFFHLLFFKDTRESAPNRFKSAASSFSAFSGFFMFFDVFSGFLMFFHVF